MVRIFLCAQLHNQRISISPEDRNFHKDKKVTGDVVMWLELIEHRTGTDAFSSTVNGVT